MEEYKLTLRRLAVRDDRYISALLSEEHANATLSGIDPQSHALLRIAALIARRRRAALVHERGRGRTRGAGASYDEIVGTLIAVIPIVGVARVVSAAPNLGAGARLRRRRRARARRRLGRPAKPDVSLARPDPLPRLALAVERDRRTRERGGRRGGGRVLASSRAAPEGSERRRDSRRRNRRGDGAARPFGPDPCAG